MPKGGGQLGYGDPVRRILLGATLILAACGPATVSPGPSGEGPAAQCGNDVACQTMLASAFKVATASIDSSSPSHPPIVSQVAYNGPKYKTAAPGTLLDVRSTLANGEVISVLVGCGVGVEVATDDCHETRVP